MLSRRRFLRDPERLGQSDVTKARVTNQALVVSLSLERRYIGSDADTLWVLTCDTGSEEDALPVSFRDRLSIIRTDISRRIAPSRCVGSFFVARPLR